MIDAPIVERVEDSAIDTSDHPCHGCANLCPSKQRFHGREWRVIVRCGLSWYPVYSRCDKFRPLALAS